MEKPKYPVMLVIDGNKREVRVERNGVAARPKCVPKAPSVLSKQVLKTFSVAASDNGGYAITLKWAHPKETMVLLCQSKKELLETLAAVVPENSYPGSGR
jgi:hypothetical protein